MRHIYILLINLFLLTALMACKGKTQQPAEEGREHYVYTDEDIRRAEAPDELSPDDANDPDVVAIYSLPDMDGDQKPETILLRERVQEGDMGVFKTIVVRYTKAGAMAHNDENGYDATDFSGIFHHFTKDNPAYTYTRRFGNTESPYLYLLKHKAQPHSYLFAGGPSFPNGNQVTFLRIADNMRDTDVALNKMLHFNFLTAHKVAGEEHLFVVGRVTMDQPFGYNADDDSFNTSYNPFVFYPLEYVPQEEVLALMKAYNEKNYVWAGPEFSNDVIVHHDAKGKVSIQR